MENKFNDYNNDNNVYGSMEGAQDNQAIDFQEHLTAPVPRDMLEHLHLTAPVS